MKKIETVKLIMFLKLAVNKILFFTFHLLMICFALTACETEPTPAQRNIVDQLIQEQLSIPFDESNRNTSANMALQQSTSVEDAMEMNRKRYSEIQEYLEKLSQSSYDQKKAWAIQFLEVELESLQRSQKASAKSSKALSDLINQRKAWLNAIKE
jgi:hypothetical protein